MKRTFKILGTIVGVVVLIAVVSAISRGATPAAPTGITPGVASVAPSNPPAAPVNSGPLTVVDAGTYHVGDEVAAGRWTSPGPDGDAALKLCMWQRARNDSGESSAVITLGTLGEKSNGSVTVKAGEFFILTGPCTWTRK